MSSRGRSRKRNVTGANEAKRRRRSTPEPSERFVLLSVTDSSTQGITVNRPPLVEEVFDISKILSDPEALSSGNDRLEDSE